MKKLIKRFFMWLFKDELDDLVAKKELVEKEVEKINEASEEYLQMSHKIECLLDNLDVSVDVHQYARNWAVVSLQGDRTDYIKFIDLGRTDAKEIIQFLNRFDRNIKIDSAPSISPYFFEIRQRGR